MTNSKLLREIINAKGYKYGYVARMLGITPNGLRKKIENDTEFKASEIKRMSAILGLSADERDIIFFT